MKAKTSKPSADPARQLLRHTVATLAYRVRKPLEGAPPDFSEFKASEKTRTPAQILAHLGDLIDWALSMANGKKVWHNSPPLPWEQGAQRLYASLEAFDKFLASDAALDCPPEQLFQGPIADSIWHVGQLALLRRMAGPPIRGENYFKADIKVGRVGRDQATPRREFD
jgi:hypothetical protein